VELSAHAVTTASVTLAPAPPTLARVTVLSKREQGLRRVGFTDRQKVGLGHFMTEEQIASKAPLVLSDVFTAMPGIQIDYSTGKPIITGSRQAGGGCVNYFIDDVPYTPQTPGDIDSYLKPDELAAVEVYNSVDVPADYSSINGCATIVIWTKTRVGG
jgi:hypothetical protein